MGGREKARLLLWWLYHQVQSDQHATIVELVLQLSQHKLANYIILVTDYIILVTDGLTEWNKYEHSYAAERL